jgi:hypothetical protein
LPNADDFARHLVFSIDQGFALHVHQIGKMALLVNQSIVSPDCLVLVVEKAGTPQTIRTETNDRNQKEHPVRFDRLHNRVAT